MADKTIVALYDDFREATRAVRELERGGFPHKDISLVANNAERRWGEKGERAHGDDTYAAEGAGTGATIGAVAGGATGLLASLGVLAIPGVGPVLAAGPPVATLTGAGLGAAAGGLVGGLVGAGVPEHEAHFYAEGVRRGGALVTIRVAAKQAKRAVDILERYDAVDVDQRQAGWRSQGWQSFDHRSEPWDVQRIDEERTRWKTKGAAGPVAGDADKTTGGGFAATTLGAAMPAPSAPAAANDRGMTDLRAGTIAEESDVARMRGGPLASAMSEEPGSTGGLREQKEPLKKGDTGLGRVRAYSGVGELAPRRSTDRAAAGNKPRKQK
jgi:hypothetical protein